MEVIKMTKAELIAKNLPTGSYAAGCPVNGRDAGGGMWYDPDGNQCSHATARRECERLG